jgi:hypothetical protein
VEKYKNIQAIGRYTARKMAIFVVFVVLVLFLVKKAVFGHFAGVIASDCLYIFA